MRTFKKALLSFVSLVCAVVLLSLIIILPGTPFERTYFCDAAARRDLAGSLDFLIVGASHSGRGFLPSVLDERLGCCSYNLSQSKMTSGGKLFLAEKELSRNPVQTVVVEVSSDTLIREEEAERAEGDAMTLSRTDTPLERLQYMIRYMQLEDWLNLYARDLLAGMRLWKDILTGDNLYRVDRSAKGQHSWDTNDVTLSPKKVAKNYNKTKLNTDYSEESVAALTELIDLCKSYGAEVIIVVCPVSDRKILRIDGWDGFRAWLKNYSAEQDCAWYDFNLLRDRYQRFSDSTTFYDYSHLSNQGAVAFTNAFVDVIQAAEAGQDTSALFYDTYEEMKADSPYMQYLDIDS